MLCVAGRHPLKQGLKPSTIQDFVRARSLVAGRHPLKQGLKLSELINVFNTVMIVAGRHPLKQGLKQDHVPGYDHACKRRRAASTKTRIETLFSMKFPCSSLSRRAASTKTRIETYGIGDSRRGRLRRRAASTKTRIETLICTHGDIASHRVAGRHPLKQGLKLNIMRMERNNVCASQGGIH